MSRFKLKLYFDNEPIEKMKFNNLDDMKPIIKNLKRKFGDK